MKVSTRWPLTKEIQEKLITALTDNLPLLRAKLNISQEELATLVGMSRQNYCSIESKKRPMMWQTYLALILFFACNEENNDLLKDLNCFPDVLIDASNQASTNDNNVRDGIEGIVNILPKLDKQGLQCLQTVALVEFARCCKMPGESVVKAFDGVDFKQSLFDGNDKLKNALRRIKNGK